ncbi:hypothetical protein A3840_17970 [Devosia elaeis]|uniref:HTH lysR-type domain-containing protein n=1 Tax=Devosia elaeis TaxID=1770058 RepID=A0A178HL20_9HYPH|nr:hypothetical protein A3840_17970 [Devosia elaeis]
MARTGSFTAAAENLHVSQPAVGLQVKLLEDRLGIPLLQRHSRGVQVTDAGRVYLGHAERILEIVDEAERSVLQFRDQQSRSVRLGVTPTVGRTILAEIVYATGRPEAELKVTFQEGVSDELYKKVCSHELEAAFCYDPVPNPAVTIAPLYTEDLCLVGPPAAVGDGTDPVEFHILRDVRLVLSPRPNRLREMIETAAAEVGITLPGMIELDLIGLKREFLLRYNHCTISPYGLLMGDIRSGQINGRPLIAPTLSRTMSLVFDRKMPALTVNALFGLVRPLIAAEIAKGELHWRPVP